jgi:hypothetical protein
MEKYYFHVTLSNSSSPSEDVKKIVTFTLPGDFRTKVIEKFMLASDQQWRIQMFDVEFNDWVDVDDPVEENLPTKARLKIIMKQMGSHEFCVHFFISIRPTSMHVSGTAYKAWRATAELQTLYLLGPVYLAIYICIYHLYIYIYIHRIYGI